MKRFALLAVLVLMTACHSGAPVGTPTATTDHSMGYESASPSDPDLHPASGPVTAGAPNAAKCGYVRWPQKTGTDADASKVSLTPKATTIATVVKQKSPLKSPGKYPPHSVKRFAPFETQVWTIHATLTAYGLEADSDLHLVIGDGKNTMIVEIPAPGCVSSGPFRTGAAAAQTAFLHKYPHPPSYPKSFAIVNQPVTVTGVGFFDYIHGQQGVAVNGAELHPLLDIKFQ